MRDDDRAPVSALLLDVYSTIVRTDFGTVLRSLAKAVGVDSRLLGRALDEHALALTIGAISLADAFGVALARCGIEVSAERRSELVRADGEQLIAATAVYGDVVPFLRELRGRGVRVALVSNCAENTRPLLQHFGIDALCDEIVLSCEVGHAKPDAAMFATALDRLGAQAHDALLVDDQAEYCAGASVLGIATLRMDRAADAGVGRRHDVVSTLHEVTHRFT